MTIKQDVIEINRRHPDWDKEKVAAFLGVSYTSVKTVANRSGLTFPPKKFLSFKRQFKRVPYAGKSSDQPEW